MTTQELLQGAKAAKAKLAALSTQEKNRALLAMAQALVDQTGAILEANAQGLAAARGTMSEVMLARLALDEGRIQGMAEGIRQVAELPDPVGKILRTVERPNGLVIQKRAVPMGVIAIIYESRPNVTSDAAALALKSGNVCVLRGGKEAYRSARAIVTALKAGLTGLGLPDTFVNLVEDTTRQSATELMHAVGYVDLLIPRGGPGLIRSCVENATVPCIQTGTGICHIYVDAAADVDMAVDIIENAKASRPSVCNAEEVCLVTPLHRPGLSAQASGPADGGAGVPGQDPGGAAAGPRTRRCSSPALRRGSRTLTRNSWTMCWPSSWWTAWSRPWSTSPSTPPATARPSSRTTRRRQSSSSPG